MSPRPHQPAAPSVPAVPAVPAALAALLMGSAAHAGVIDYRPELGTFPSAHGWDVFATGGGETGAVIDSVLVYGPSSTPEVNYWEHAFETPVAVVRPFNTFGPRQSNRAVIPTVITQLANGLAAGATEIKLGALEPRRDFTYATDTAEGIIAVAESDNTVGEHINLGTGYDVSIAETVDLIKDIMGSSATVTCDQQRLRPEGSEVDRLLACNKKARELTGWTPELTGPAGFREAMTRTIDWFTDPANLARYKADQYAT